MHELKMKRVKGSAAYQGLSGIEQGEGGGKGMGIEMDCVVYKIDG